MKRLDEKNSVFVGNDLRHLVYNKSKTFFESFGIHDVTEYVQEILKSHMNPPNVVSDTTERGLAQIKKNRW